MIRRRRFRSRLFSCGLAAALAAAPAGAADFSLFGDVTLVDSDAPESPASFALGLLDFYVTQEITDRMPGFVELVVAAGDEGEFEADVERLWIRYDVSNAFQIAAGRFHTPLGTWNRTYHHGALIQDTVGRPYFLAFEDDGGILPVHIVGLMATGETWAGVGTFRYELAVGNGQELSSAAGLDPAPEDRPELDPNNVDDLNDDKTLSGRLSLKGDKGWQLGIFGLTQEIAESGAPEAGSLLATGETLVDQTIFGLDVRYQAGRFGFLGEVFDIDNESPVGAGGSHGATAFYLQAWFDPAENWRLSYRFASLDVEELDPFFRLLGVEEQDHNLLTVGYRMGEVGVIKLEVDRLTSGSTRLDDQTILRAQWAFLIP